MRNYLHTGDIVTVPAPYALAGGDGCQVVALFGVATGAAASGAAAEIKTSGVFALAAATAATAAIGAKAYWDDTNKHVTATASTHALIGVFVATKVATETVATVRLGGAV